MLNNREGDQTTMLAFGIWKIDKYILRDVINLQAFQAGMFLYLGQKTCPSSRIKDLVSKIRTLLDFLQAE